MLSTEELQPGTCLKENVNGAVIVIVKVEEEEGSIYYQHYGNKQIFFYGLEGFRRCNLRILDQPQADL